MTFNIQARIKGIKGINKSGIPINQIRGVQIHKQNMDYEDTLSNSTHDNSLLLQSTQQLEYYTKGISKEDRVEEVRKARQKLHSLLRKVDDQTGLSRKEEDEMVQLEQKLQYLLTLCDKQKKQETQHFRGRIAQTTVAIQQSQEIPRHRQNMMMSINETGCTIDLEKDRFKNYQGQDYLEIERIQSSFQTQQTQINQLINLIRLIAFKSLQSLEEEQEIKQRNIFAFECFKKIKAHKNQNLRKQKRDQSKKKN